MQCVDTAEAKVAAASGALQIASRRMTLAVRNTDAFYSIFRKRKTISKISLFCQTISAHLKENGTPWQALITLIVMYTLQHMICEAHNPTQSGHIDKIRKNT